MIGIYDNRLSDDKARDYPEAEATAVEFYATRIMGELPVTWRDAEALVRITCRGFAHSLIAEKQTLEDYCEIWPTPWKKNPHYRGPHRYGN